jgi:hypothetical protein
MPFVGIEGMEARGLMEGMDISAAQAQGLGTIIDLSL